MAFVKSYTTVMVSLVWLAVGCKNSSSTTPTATTKPKVSTSTTTSTSTSNSSGISSIAPSTTTTSTTAPIDGKAAGVYAVGTCVKSGTTTQSAWLNGVWSPLPSTSSAAVPIGLDIASDGTLTVGTALGSWKNGVWTDLDMKADISYSLYDQVKSGTDIYTIGKSGFYKNNVFVDITKSKPMSSAAVVLGKLFVDGTDVHMMVLSKETDGTMKLYAYKNMTLVSTTPLPDGTDAYNGFFMEKVGNDVIHHALIIKHATGSTQSTTASYIREGVSKDIIIDTNNVVHQILDLYVSGTSIQALMNVARVDDSSHADVKLWKDGSLSSLGIPDGYSVSVAAKTFFFKKFGTDLYFTLTAINGDNVQTSGYIKGSTFVPLKCPDSGKATILNLTVKN